MVALVGGDRLEAVGGFGDDEQVGFLIDDVRDAGSQQRVVVDHQHAGRPKRAAPAVSAAMASSVARVVGGSHASTTSVPARGAVTMVSDAPMRSARSCMLVRPNPVPRRSCAMPRPSSATDRRKPTDARARGLDGDAPGARVARGVVQRFLRDADDFALDALVEARQLLEHQSIGTSVLSRAVPPGARAPVAMSSPRPSIGRSAPTERRASTRWVRARSTARVSARRDRRRQRVAFR